MRCKKLSRLFSSLSGRLYRQYLTPRPCRPFTRFLVPDVRTCASSQSTRARSLAVCLTNVRALVLEFGGSFQQCVPDVALVSKFVQTLSNLQRRLGWLWGMRGCLFGLSGCLDCLFQLMYWLVSFGVGVVGFLRFDVWFCGGVLFERWLFEWVWF